MASRSLHSLVELVAQLRAPDGCPWDRAQTHQSLTGFLIEEAYEVVHAIDEADSRALKDELGDLLLHVAFHVQLAREAEEFNLDEVLDGIHEKVIRRHPHVFGKTAPNELESIKLKWEELKDREQVGKPKKAVAFPALVEARKLLEQASNRGAKPAELISSHDRKLSGELRAHLEENPGALGDLLLELVALGRELGVEPEIALKQSSKKLSRLLEQRDKASLPTSKE